MRQAGEDVLYMAEAAPATTDTEAVALAQAEGRLLLTEDKDFGDLVFSRRQSIPGVVFMRIESTARELRWVRLKLAISTFGADMFGRYTVVEPARFRSRPLPDAR
jgi:predicted nuclease of predicted toxin-antitoxin system